jgi:predicted nucleotidyltransferase
MSEFNLEIALPTIRDYVACQPEIVLAYLYGSYTVGQTWAASDLDIQQIRVFLDAQEEGR